MAAVPPQGSSREEEEPIFGDLGGEDEGPVGLASLAGLKPKANSAAEAEDAAQPEEHLSGQAEVPVEEEEEVEAEVEVSDAEVEEFLAELAGRPAVDPTPKGVVPVDPFETDERAADVFRELRSLPSRTLIYKRGMPDQQMLLTLKDRMSMLADFAQQGNWKRARFVMRGLWRKKKLRLPLGRILWNLMIKAHVRAGRPRAAESWLVDMLDRVYQPDRFSYNTLLHGYAKQGNYLKAEEWLRRMRARGVTPDDWSYAAVANAHAEADSLEGAERTVEAMLRSGCQVNTAVPYNAILKVCAKHGHELIAEKWLKKMKAKTRPDKVTYLLLIKAASETDRAARWLDVMQKSRVKPGREHFHAVMMSFARSGDLAGVDAWVRVMRDRGLQPDVYTYNIWLAAAAQKGDREAAEGIVAMMQEDDVTPDLVTYSTVIGAFAEAADDEGAQRWLFRAESEGLDPDLKCYNQAIKACARAGKSEQAEHLARRLLRHSLTPDMYTYNTLLSALAKEGSPGSAEFWIDHMQRQARWRHLDFSLKQTAIAYAEVLLAHTRAGNLEAAEAWFSRMLGEGVEPDGRCYIALARGYLDQGREADAQRWCERMKSWSNLEPPRYLLASVYPKEPVPVE